MVKPDNSFNTLEETCFTPEPTELSAIASRCHSSSIGKLLPDAFYIHILSVHALDPLLQEYESRARSAAPQVQEATLVKFSTNKPKISYLFYPDFDTDPHPALQASIQVDLETLQVNYRDYRTSENPPVLHRKETFVTSDYHLYEQFAALTRAQEALGLLNNSKGIGTRVGWQKRLQAYGVEIQGYTIIQRQKTIPRVTVAPQIDRHKAAIVRNDFSRPVRLALETNLFTPDTTFFDYGCGHGGDVIRLGQQGYHSCGWDPYYSPDTNQGPADIVNIGFVINVIEDQSERREALVKAWELTQKVLLVAAQVLIADTNRGVVAYGDGIITNRNTFQKYYDQEELKIYIDQVLGVDAIPVALGVYFVFKDEAQAQLFRASRYRSRATTPRVRACIKRFEDYQELLTPLMAFVTERGRLPSKDELPQEADISGEFGSLRRAFQVILQATDPQEWEGISEKRRQDLMVYLALCQFSQRPKLSNLVREAQEDILGLFGSYKQAWLNADQMLHSLGDRSNIIERCQNSPVGKKLPNSLWVHISALQSLDPLLRLYEGCASRTIGRLEEANVIKFHAKTPKISYLFYPDFDVDPHPGLHTGMEIDLRDLHVTYRDYDIDDDPPVLHQKDALVTPDYPQYEKFAKLTRQEEDWGLLNNWRSISHLSGWRKCLADNCAILKNYHLYWCKDADPYKLKVLRSAVESRQQKRRKATKKQKSELDTSTNIESEES
ncbi:DNA phosphorothioation-associated putative methyltransferase [Cylindrospermum sp. FACHB-282]|uniref:DNA phosphorothioation-associated putative methyltransferase n=1 Tax=Cylindrospermum sp. FACHB-282 TaxID=2692794 RepID=UPI001684C6B9|nr:DNA phosphorothioation-associated putative methyltransferase [Cylindrospermum sp. FACHB-282]MBD2386705.1 DNA phosphorothioation-associated putative methyltransferase [Cylindrospermum sp. FACHB-282]